MTTTVLATAKRGQLRLQIVKIGRLHALRISGPLTMPRTYVMPKQRALRVKRGLRTFDLASVL